MSEQTARQIARPTQPTTRQQVLLRAVVSSLVLCAALAPTVRAQTNGAGGPPMQPVEGTDTARAQQAQINLVPFRQLALRGAQAYARGELSLDDALELQLEADRAEDGTLNNILIGGSSAANPTLNAFAKDFVAALSDSRALAAPALSDAHHLNLALNFDGRALNASVSTELSSAEVAQKQARGYQGLLYLGAMARRGTDAEVVFKNMTATASGKQLALRLELSRAALGNLLSHYLQSIP
jgi:hypothetical protein